MCVCVCVCVCVRVRAGGVDVQEESQTAEPAAALRGVWHPFSGHLGGAGTEEWHGQTPHRRNKRGGERQLCVCVCVCVIHL